MKQNNKKSAKAKACHCGCRGVCSGACSKMRSRQDMHGSYTGVPLGEADEIVQDADDL